MTATVGRAENARQAKSAYRRVVLFVLGPQRSGTSAITRVLSLSGGALPAGMLGADAGNPRGYWEPRKAIAINETILYRHKSAWFDPSLRSMDDDVLDANEKAACIAQIEDYLTGLPTAPLLVIKEPRITTLSHLWFEAARRTGFEVAAVIAVRHPMEVISSVAATWQVSRELSGALWLKYSLLAERYTRDLPRVFVDYADFLDNWRREIKRISTTLDVELNTQQEAAIEEFLSADLRRQRHSGCVKGLGGADWISTVHDTLCASAHDEPLDGAPLDRIYESYRANEHELRSAFEDFRALSKRALYRFLRPSIAMPMMEFVAMAHRRRGTWA
ncbi:sulfotransferase family protein [Mycobacterium sp. Aquia_213]|uniref:sulfotransferase family protein n=1 Tax=Mycobacterium sp. Aquia_213 TaxID=2991728 RepID=UPI00226F944E|nr:sulfotransferase family protein [Mycobacterium sp. Aquia_213]WAC89483.1 sulfotransferase family protein [Mycobacterium sp. Aquia_213]